MRRVGMTTATLTRMILPNHTCPFGVRAKEMLEAAGYTVDDRILSTREDHIAPALSVYRGSKLFGGPVRLTMAGSGHIAGVVNPPEKKKYQYWSGAPAPTLKEWMVKAAETAGSWWPDWASWLAAFSGPKVTPRNPSNGPLWAIEDAPGSYVKSRDEVTERAGAA